MGILDDINEAIAGKTGADAEAAVEDLVVEKPKKAKATDVAPVANGSGALKSGIKVSGPKE